MYQRLYQLQFADDADGTHRAGYGGRSQSLSKQSNSQTAPTADLFDDRFRAASRAGQRIAWLDAGAEGGKSSLSRSAHAHAGGFGGAGDAVAPPAEVRNPARASGSHPHHRARIAAPGGDGPRPGRGLYRGLPRCGHGASSARDPQPADHPAAARRLSHQRTGRERQWQRRCTYAPRWS